LGLRTASRQEFLASLPSPIIIIIMDYAVVTVAFATVVAVVTLSSLIVAPAVEPSVPKDVSFVPTAIEVETVSTSDESDDTEQTDRVVVTDTEPEEPALQEETMTEEVPEQKLASSKGRWGLSFRSKKAAAEVQGEVAEQKPATPDKKKSFRWTRVKK
jgi:hypothetical protein